MGLFKHRDKSQTRPELVPPKNDQNQNGPHNNSYHDSTYYSNSNASTIDGPSKQSQAPQQQGPLPGTTVTTTTTTTTTITTVSADGTTHTYSHPYNPTTDPPPQATETHVDQKLPANTGVTNNTQPTPQVQDQKPTQPANQAQNAPPIIQHQAPTPTQNTALYTAPPPRKPTPQQSTQYAPPPQMNELETTPADRSPSTTGGRIIPPRSELRTSPNLQTDTSPLGSPAMPQRSEKRNSRDGIIAPLNTSPRTHENETYTPVSPTSSTTFSRPNHAPPPPPKESTYPTIPGPTAAQTERLGKRESLGAMFKGVHGAGEAIRGSVNQKIAHTMHDTAEEERMRIVRENGLGEWKGSGLSERVPVGLREGFREKAEGRMRVRRASQDRNAVHGSEGPGGLGVLEESRYG